MPVLLAGGCRVKGLKEGEALTDGSVKIWRHVDRAAGAKAISLRVLEFTRGTSPGLRNLSCDDVLYVLEGEGTVFLDGWPHPIAPGTGIYVRPGVCLAVQNAGPAALLLLSSRCPDPGPSVDFEEPATSPPVGAKALSPLPIVRLGEQKIQFTDDGRSFRVLVDERVGSTQVTQFVGAIPPSRAPDHFHEYEEVACILEGKGHLWTGQRSAPVQTGSCIFLPRRQPHCLENNGTDELRLVGMLYPASSPAVRYCAD